jgi:hypothetical protein
MLERNVFNSINLAWWLVRLLVSLYIRLFFNIAIRCVFIRNYLTL